MDNIENKNSTYKIEDIPLNKLKEFENHPFPMMQESQFVALKEDMAKNGLLEAIVVRPIPDDQKSESPEKEYEILSGHNRVRAAQELEWKIIKAEIRENLADEQALAHVINSNLTRQSFIDFPHSVKAKILKMRQQILAEEKQAAIINEINLLENPDKIKKNPTGRQIDNESANGERINEKLEAEYHLDDRTVARYIRIVDHLNKNLLDKVDENIIPFIAGVELSFLREEEQESINDVINDTLSLKITVKKAETLKKYSKYNKLSKNKVIDLLTTNKKSSLDKKISKSATIDNISQHLKDKKVSKNIKTEIITAVTLTKKTMPDLISNYSSITEPTQEDMEKFIASIRRSFEVGNIESQNNEE